MGRFRRCPRTLPWSAPGGSLPVPRRGLLAALLVGLATVTVTLPSAAGATPTATTSSTTTSSPAVVPSPATSTTTPSTTTPSTTTTAAPTTTTTAASAPQPQTTTKTVPAYWLVASDGGIFSFGGAPYYGSMGGKPLNRPIVGIAATPSSSGYWEVASDGGIFSFGTGATFYGSMGNVVLNKPVVGIAATHDGNGYWEVASDGGIFSFGDAAFYGSMGGHPLNQPIVGMAPTADGKGYWEVAADGGIFSFGDAHFYGSTGNIVLNKPIVSMTATADGKGYWFTASDGGVFAYGDATYYGSLGSIPQSRPIVTMASDTTGKGYWFSNNNGAVTAYGDATYWGSAPQVLNAPVVAMAPAIGSGNFSGSSYPSGSYGYDISNYQCANVPPAPHTIGIVEVVGGSFGTVNRCLADEAAWAGGGLNLYMYLTYGTATTTADGNCATTALPAACQFGWNAALDAYGKAQATGINTGVAWWVDVESDPAWTSNLGANAAVVQGALDALRYEGLNNVGIYASPGSWSGIVGDYTPAVPYWAADWGLSPATTCTNVHAKYPILPSGPVQVVQYSSPSATYAAGGMDLSFDDDYAC